MTELRAVIVGQLVMALLVQVLLGLSTDSQVVVLAAVLILALFLVDIVSAVYVGLLFLKDGSIPRLWLFAFLAYICVTIVGGLVLIVMSGVVPVFLPIKLSLREFVTLLGSGILLIGTVPVMLAALAYLASRYEAPLQPAGPAVPEQNAEPASEIPLTPGDVGAAVDDGNLEDLRVPVHPKLDQGPAG